ncbi:TPA: hypothetical protein ACH3X2_004802 [Trebouxia sp. C0005]
MSVCHKIRLSAHSQLVLLCTALLVAAEWGNLPVGICQQVIGFDTLTFGKGAQVCKAWNHASKSEGAGPRVMALNWIELYDRHKAFDRFTEHAPPDLRTLSLSTMFLIGIYSARSHRV